MKIVYYANGKTMVGLEDARDLTNSELRDVIERAASARGCFKEAQSVMALAKTKIDLISVINSIAVTCGEYHKNEKCGGYDVVFNFE